MISDSAARPWAGHYLYSAASSYPCPSASVVAADGSVVHSWTSAEDQVPPEDDPPTFLRGWNHVEADLDGNLFAIIPLKSLLKLDRSSRLVWRAEVAAHHDLALTATGSILVLTETPRLVPTRNRERLVLDNEVTVLDADGAILAQHSLYDILSSDPVLAEVIQQRIHSRYGAFDPDGDVFTGADRGPDVARLLRTGQYAGSKRRALQSLRQLPGSPCDVLHANTVEVIEAPTPAGWLPGQVLVSIRNLDTVALLDLGRGRVVWHWGSGVLSGQHQPSVLPDGRLLVFDNGVEVGRSRVLIVDPITEQVVWEYLGSPPESFFSAVAGGCELLPNGNILVTEAQAGRAFELTRAGRTVWSWQLTAPPSAAGSTSRAAIYRMAAVSERLVASLTARDQVGCPISSSRSS